MLAGGGRLGDDVVMAIGAAERRLGGDEDALDADPFAHLRLVHDALKEDVESPVGLACVPVTPRENGDHDGDKDMENEEDESEIGDQGHVRKREQARNRHS